jgi:phosphatidylserine/phosphatidylglycerophosphate/cardiolipin synthase-like enzyme
VGAGSAQDRDRRFSQNKYFTHNKVMVINNKTVVTGSYNFSETNDENLVIIESPAIAAAYTRCFCSSNTRRTDLAACGESHRYFATVSCNGLNKV